MAELATEQLIYLLYASAYTEEGTVTKGTVKSNLPSEWKEKADKIHDALKTQKLLEAKTKGGKPTTREGRFSVAEQGRRVLVTDLATTDYDFASSKSYKVLNTLINCLLDRIKDVAEAHPKVKESEEMLFDEFQEKFKALYFEERRQQELRGVVAIHSKELCQKFTKQNSISQEKLSGYFEMLKSTGEIFAVDEKGSELIQWVE